MCGLKTIRLWLPVLLSLSAGVAIAKTVAEASQSVPCANVTMFNAGNISELPQSTRTAIKAAVEPSIQAIVSDKAMGMEGKAVKAVPLSAIRISQGIHDSTLYIVSWDDSSFGVNGAIWIVEVTSRGARNLVGLPKGQSPGYSLGGFGFDVLSAPATAYPDIMIASSGFKDGGGAEAEEVCVGKKGMYYEKIACPVTCHKVLNDR